jgi:hypothetical protein
MCFFLYFFLFSHTQGYLCFGMFCRKFFVVNMVHLLYGFLCWLFIYGCYVFYVFIWLFIFVLLFGVILGFSLNFRKFRKCVYLLEIVYICKVYVTFLYYIFIICMTNWVAHMVLRYFRNWCRGQSGRGSAWRKIRNRKFFRKNFFGKT